MHTLLKPIAVASLLFFSSACQVNSEVADTGQNEMPCDQSTKTFDVTGAAEPFLLLTQLPVGHYRHESAEIYIESRFTRADGTLSLSRVQLLETPIVNSNPPAYTVTSRCRETAGNFSTYFTQVPMITDIRNYDRARFDFGSLAYTVNFQSEFKPEFAVNFSGDTRSANTGTVLNTINSFWNSSYRFARRTGEIYEFYGVRIEVGTGRTIYGKSVYSRTSALP